jgi:glucokinase
MKIGIDLGGTNIRAGLIEAGAILSVKHAFLTEKDSLQKTLSQLISVVAPLVNPAVKGIGIGVPSVVDVENGIVFDVVNIPSWKRVELKKILEKEFKIPVYINNDVNCFALGEHRYGGANSMKKAMADFQFPETIKKLKIQHSQVENIALLGAAALVKGA